MHRNTFGDPRPRNVVEMGEAFNERDADREECIADLYSPDDEEDRPEWQGWTAEVRTSAEGSEVFSTMGYASEDAIRRDLASAGIPEANIEIVE